MSDFYQGNRSSVHRMVGEHRKVTRLLERARGENGARVRVHNGRLIISAPSGGMSLRKFPFGWMGTDGQQAIIGTGYVEGRYGYREVFGSNAHPRGWRVNVGGNSTAKHLILATGNETTAQILQDSVLESSFTGDTANEWRRILYRVYLSNGRPVLDRVGSGVGGIVL